MPDLMRRLDAALAALTGGNMAGTPERGVYYLLLAMAEKGELLVSANTKYTNPKWECWHDDKQGVTRSVGADTLIEAVVGTAEKLIQAKEKP